MPSGQSPRSNLLARFAAANRTLANMRKDIPDTATGAKSLFERAIQSYSNRMTSLGESLLRANPNYSSLARRLSKMENSLDTNAERLMRMRKGGK